MPPLREITLFYSFFQLGMTQHNDCSSREHYICTDTKCIGYIDRHNLIQVIAHVLQLTCDDNTREIHRSECNDITHFHGVSTCTTSILDYLTRISILLPHVSSINFVVMCMYMNMYGHILHNKANIINHYTIHRLIITSIMLSVKFHEDSYTSNKGFAAIGGIALRELNTLEIDMLSTLQFQLYISIDRLAYEYESLILFIRHTTISRAVNEVSSCVIRLSPAVENLNANRQQLVQSTNVSQSNYTINNNSVDHPAG